MPTYEYICQGCGHRSEQFQSITAKPLRTCPKCGKKRLKRLIGTGAGIIFKGSGFYQTDYRSESYKKGAESEKKSREKQTATTDSKKGEGKDAKSGDKTESTAKDKKKSA